MKWVRARDGAIFGVAKGLAHSLEIPVGMFRLFWLFSVLFFGAGIGLYLILAISLPREDRLAQAREPWILGVCAKIAKRTQVEVGVVRFMAILLAIMSFGATIVGYFVLYFIMDEPSDYRDSDNKPSTPPSIT